MVFLRLFENISASSLVSVASESLKQFVYQQKDQLSGLLSPPVNDCIDEEAARQEFIMQWEAPIVPQMYADREEIAFNFAFDKILHSKETDWEKKFEEFTFNLAFHEILESKETEWEKKFEQFQQTYRLGF